jgi:membrane protease YdiL (CAAX protease family)
MPVWVAFVVAVVVLVVASVLNNRLARSAYLATAVVTTAVLLAWYAFAGGDWAAAGLGRAGLGRGVRWGLVLAALVAVVYLAGALVPATRPLFVDRRVEHASAGQIAFQALVRIPFGTVLLEEVAFRGVLYGLLVGATGPVWAAALSSVLFGLWHVPGAASLSGRNPAVGHTFGSRPWLVVPATVAAMTVAGVVLCELQRRSGSLAAPAALHWAVNALGLLTAFVVTRRPRVR